MFVSTFFLILGVKQITRNKDEVLEGLFGSLGESSDCISLGRPWEILGRPWEVLGRSSGVLGAKTKYRGQARIANKRNYQTNNGFMMFVGVLERGVLLQRCSTSPQARGLSGLICPNTKHLL
jgi:hypothetical protein